MKKNIAKIHKYLGLIAIIPTFFWCLSALTHPIMAHFYKDTVAKKNYVSPKINKSLLKIKPEEILSNNKINTFQKLNIVSISKEHFYQVKVNDSIIKYFNTFNGKELVNGDEIYATYLANYFLNSKGLQPDKIEKLTTFNQTYKFVNRYLPVYEIYFSYPDSYLYINTLESKLATTNTESKKWLLQIFDVFHNLSFVKIFPSELQSIIVLGLLSFICLSSISGLIYYGLFYKKMQKTKKLSITILQKRRSHRRYGLYFSLFSLTFCFSGGYHYFHKKYGKIKETTSYSTFFETSKLKSDLQNLNTISNSISLVEYKSNYYWKNTQNKKEEIIENDYFNLNNKIQNKNFEVNLAKYYFNKITQKTSIEKVDYLTDFDKRDYGFINKRLPVYRITLKNNEKYFLDINAVLIANHTTKSDKVEGISFAVLHKFMFLDFLGKPLRDLIICFIIFGLISTTYKGIRLLFYTK